MTLSETGTARGDLPAKGYDIHCPLMGGSGVNYLASSCLERLANKGCRMTGCSRHRRPEGNKPEKVVAKAVVAKCKIIPVAPAIGEPRQEAAMSTNGQEAAANARGKQRSGKATKHKVGPCANPACGRVMPLPGRGLCGKCYSAVLKTEKGGGALRGELRQDTARPRTPSCGVQELQVVITFAGGDKALLEKLEVSAQQSRRSVENQVLFLLEDVLMTQGRAK